MKLETNVAGVTFDGRQNILKSLYGKPVRAELRLEPENKVNSLAVAVYLNGSKVGYIPDDICDVVHDYIDRVDEVAAAVECYEVYYVMLAIIFREDEDGDA